MRLKVNYVSAITSTLLASLLSGCVTPYVPPSASSPAARVQFPSEPSVIIYSDDSCSGRQHIGRDFKGKPISIAAGRPVFIVMEMEATGYAVGSRQCRVNFAFTPQDAASYRVVWRGGPFDCSGGVFRVGDDGHNEQVATQAFDRKAACVLIQ